MAIFSFLEFTLWSSASEALRGLKKTRKKKATLKSPRIQTQQQQQSAVSSQPASHSASEWF